MKTYLFERKFNKTKRTEDIEHQLHVGIERLRQLIDEALADPRTTWIYIAEEKVGARS